MPPFILWAMGIVGGALIGRFVLKEAERINEELHRYDVKSSPAERETLPKLEPDPETGVYRPKSAPAESSPG